MLNDCKAPGILQVEDVLQVNVSQGVAPPAYVGRNTLNVMLLLLSRLISKVVTGFTDRLSPTGHV